MLPFLCVVGASSAAAFKASMINSVSGVSSFAANVAYDALANDSFFMQLEEEQQKEIMQASAELVDALESGDPAKIAEARRAQA